MPGFDGTGPMGGGSMTGWGRGYCYALAGGAFGPVYGRGRGYARGFGRGLAQVGFRRGFGPGWGRGYGRGFGRRQLYPPSGGWYGPAY